jgi:hypothetical protein
VCRLHTKDPQCNAQAAQLVQVSDKAKGLIGSPRNSVSLIETPIVKLRLPLTQLGRVHYS